MGSFLWDPVVESVMLKIHLSYLKNGIIRQTSSLERPMNNKSFTTLVGLFMALALISSPSLAEYVTPGLGSVLSMDELVSMSGGAVTGSGGVYQVNDSVVVSQGDRLEIAPGNTLTFVDIAGNIGLEIQGGLRALATADAPILMTGSQTSPGSWRGLDFRNTNQASEFHLDHVEISYADIAIDAAGGDIFLENCDIHHSLDKAVDISSAAGMISACHIHHNQQRTVTMTLSATPTFEHCTLDNNNLDNTSPYPYFNVGLQGINSPIIYGCIIEGSGNQMSGGMAFWASCNALVENNTITGCGYGILCYSTGANPAIIGNTIQDNNIHPDTVNWGFGVACNGSNAPILMDNQITGHWYGVAAINGGMPNLGNLENDLPFDDGQNLIFNNGLGDDTFGFYNNTALAQMAQFNCWGPVGAEDSIYHQVDDPALGLVNFAPVCNFTSVPRTALPSILGAVSAFPNPFNPRVEIKLSLAHDSHISVVVMDVAGRLVRELQGSVLSRGEHVLVWDGNNRSGQAAASGVYFYRVVAGNESETGKLVLVR